MYADTMTEPPTEDEARWRIALAKDRRFDGAFVTGVHSTGIYCRPSCPARPPRHRPASRRTRRFRAAAAAPGTRGGNRCRSSARR